VGDAVSNDLNGKALGIADRLVPGLAVAHYAWQFEGLRDPAPVFFPIKFDRDIHSLIIPPPENGRLQIESPAVNLTNQYPQNLTLCDSSSSSYCAQAEFLGESDEKPFRPADIAEPIWSLYWTTSPTSCAPRLRSLSIVFVDVAHGEHDAEVDWSVHRGGAVIPRRQEA
jgi:hypothetical protein